MGTYVTVEDPTKTVKKAGQRLSGRLVEVNWLDDFWWRNKIIDICFRW